jgi:hypothetical protein
MTTLTAETREATALTIEEYAQEVAAFVASKGIDYSDTEAFTAAIGDIVNAHLRQQRKLTEWMINRAQELETGLGF